MADQSSVARPWRWGPMLLTVVPLGIAVLVPWLAGLSLYPGATLVGVLGFLAYRLFVVRFGLCRDHRRGILLLRRGKFEAGLAAFLLSEEAWDKRPVLDRYRAVVLGSAVAWRFSTLARYNQAYALSRLGRGEEALAKLEQVLEEDPTMYMARELRDVLLAGAALHPEVGAAMKS